MSIYHEQAMELVKAQASVKAMTPAEMIAMRDELAAKLAGEPEAVVVEEAVTPIMDPKAAIKESSITCLICGAKMKVLTAKHLAKHDITPEQYRAQFGYKKKQALACKALSRARKAKMGEMELWKRRTKNTDVKVETKPAGKPKTKAVEAVAS